MEALINVKYTEWLANGEHFPGGSQEIEVSDELAPLLASAVDNGSVELEDPSEELLRALARHVETQERSEANLAEAMGTWVAPERLEDGTLEPGFWTGPWYEGHIAQRELDASKTAEIVVDIEPTDAQVLEATDVAS